jgi:SAM-dependent methyltransferase
MATCLCGHTALLKLKLRTDVYECSNCRLRFAADARFNTEFVSNLDEEVRVAALRAVRSANFDVIVQRMVTLLPKGAAGLDVGTAYGWFIEHAMREGFACSGLEPEHELWLHSTAKGLNVAKGFFPQDLPSHFVDFDFVVFNDVLEHIPDVDTVLSECYRILKPGGLLIINIPLSSGIFYTIAERLFQIGLPSFANRMWQFDFHSPHFYYFNKQNLQACVERRGFELIHYDRLETLQADTIEQRISMDRNWARAAKPLHWLLRAVHPLFNRLNEDIGCFYFTKMLETKG